MISTTAVSFLLYFTLPMSINVNIIPICKACMESGCHIVVRSARRNAKAKHARMDLDRDREAQRAEAPNVEEVLATNEAREVAAPTTTLAKKKRNVRSTRRYVKC